MLKKISKKKKKQQTQGMTGIAYEEKKGQFNK